MTQNINIRPDVGVYSTYRRLSYRPWYAIAEFVDNSTQNYYDNRKILIKKYKKERDPGKLVVEINYDGESNSLSILDNANGMNIEELTRAIVLNKPPMDCSGRCEFGMGLKTAACWYGSIWTIRTSRLGANKEYEVTINIDELTQNKSETIPVTERSVSKESHYTHITISRLYKPIRGRTSTRIKEQLGSMYREDLRTGKIKILWNGAPVSFDEPPILVEKLEGGINNTWKKNVSFTVQWDIEDIELEVRGWIGVRIPGRQRDAGLVLLRRGRVVVGGPYMGYKPIEVFGQGNTFRSQRLIGELHLDEWPVTQAKDTFDWSGGLEDAFIQELKLHCQDYMDKAEGYREKSKPLTNGDLKLVLEIPKKIYTSKKFGQAVSQELEFPEPPKTKEQEIKDTEKLKQVSIGPILFELNVGANEWIFRLHWQDQLSDAHWMQVSYPQDNLIDVFLNLAHPFFIPYVEKKDTLELLQQFVLALALAEKMARLTSTNGLVEPGDIRNYMNRVLRRASEIEVQSTE